MTDEPRRTVDLHTLLGYELGQRDLVPLLERLTNVCEILSSPRHPEREDLFFNRQDVTARLIHEARTMIERIKGIPPAPPEVPWDDEHQPRPPPPPA